MGKRSKNEIEEIEIAVFAFTKDSQVNEHLVNRDSYRFVMDTFQILMNKNNVVSNKVGISGYKEDVASYISALIELYYYNHVEVNLLDDVSEYDPDYVPDNFENDLDPL